jgi:uncharacterized membrane protein
MKRAFLIIFFLTLLFNAISYFLLPEQAAIHFSRGGHADSWAPREIHCLLFTGIDVLLFLLFWYSPNLMLNTPAKWVNLPHKSFWLAKENRPLTRKKLEFHMLEFGIAMFILFFFLSVLSVDANRSHPVKLNESLLISFVVIFLVYTVYWIIKFYRSFRIPKEPGQ